MNIVDALKQELSPLRVVGDDRWLAYDEDTSEWVVYRKGTRFSGVEVYRGTSEEVAVSHLLGER